MTNLHIDCIAIGLRHLSVCRSKNETEEKARKANVSVLRHDSRLFIYLWDLYLYLFGESVALEIWYKYGRNIEEIKPYPISDIK